MRYNRRGRLVMSKQPLLQSKPPRSGQHKSALVQTKKKYSASVSCLSSDQSLYAGESAAGIIKMGSQNYSTDDADDDGDVRKTRRGLALG
jgi:hypothetical protein